MRKAVPLDGFFYYKSHEEIEQNRRQEGRAVFIRRINDWFTCWKLNR